MQGEARWTSLDHTAIRDRLHARGGPVSIAVVTRVLNKHTSGPRRMVKQKTVTHDPNRNRQCEQIQAVTEADVGGPNPMLSLETKKKSPLGHSLGRGRSLSTRARSMWSLIRAFRAMRPAV